MTRQRMTEIKTLSHDSYSDAQNVLLAEGQGIFDQREHDQAQQTILLCKAIDELAAQVPITET